MCVRGLRTSQAATQSGLRKAGTGAYGRERNPGAVGRCVENFSPAQALEETGAGGPLSIQLSAPSTLSDPPFCSYHSPLLAPPGPQLSSMHPQVVAWVGGGCPLSNFLGNVGSLPRGQDSLFSRRCPGSLGFAVGTSS